MASSSSFLCKVPFCRTLVAVALLGLSAPPVLAKGPELSAIEVYPIGDSQGYVQISGFTLNAKNEVHLCGGATSISKNNYGKLAKVPLATGMTIERGSDGVLMLTRGGTAECIVPGNLKLEKSEGETPAELASRAELGGQVQSTSESLAPSGPPSLVPGAPPQLAPGVKIVLVATLDAEQAEFLLAQSGHTLKSWQRYLGKYPAGPHAGEAKAALSGLFVQAGQSELTAYQASLKAGQANYARLQAARAALDSAMAKAPGNAGTDGLTVGIQQETKGISAKGQAEVELYKAALVNQTSGYLHLEAAEKLAQVALSLDQKAPETVALTQACTQQRTLIDHSFVDFQNKLSARRPDEAWEAIQPLRPFAGEYPRVQKALQDLYATYIDRSKKDAEQNDLQGEVTELKKAALVEPGPAVAEMVRDAQRQEKEATDKAAVKFAMTSSDSAEEDKDIVRAYEVLDNLTPDQKKTPEVVDRMAALKDRFVAVARTKAIDLQKAYTPINIIADERGIQRAYRLLVSCHALSDDPTLQDHISSIADSISAYYLTRAKYFLSLPDGTGTNLGYAYLQAALPYKAANQGEVRAEMQRANAAYQLRSRLSIKVEFRDQTSRRDQVLFAEQLTDSLATGLETSNHDVIKVVRPKESTVVPPNFTLVGDVLEHSQSNAVVERVAKASKYRSGEHDVVNDAWSEVNRELEDANAAKATADSKLQGAVARGKKGPLEDANREVAEATEKVKALRLKLDNTQHFHTEQTERAYTYNEQQNHLTATVVLQFKIVDSTGNVVVPVFQIPKTAETTSTTVVDANPQDLMGVRNSGGADAGSQFMEKVEYGARDSLLKQANEKAASLPAFILQAGDRKATDGDNDGAAEQYLLYLNTTESTPTPERKKAQKFLLENFNFRDYGESTPSA